MVRGRSGLSPGRRSRCGALDCGAVKGGRRGDGGAGCASVVYFLSFSWRGYGSIRAIESIDVLCTVTGGGCFGMWALCASFCGESISPATTLEDWLRPQDLVPNREIDKHTIISHFNRALSTESTSKRVGLSSGEEIYLLASFIVP